MDRLLREHLEATYFAEYQVLRDELVGILVDDDLAYRPGPGAFSLVYLRTMGKALPGHWPAWIG